MTHTRSLGRTLLVIVLLLVGVGLIWKVGQSLSPAKAIPAPPPVPVKAEPVKSAPDVVSRETPVVKPVVPEGAAPRILSTERGRFIATDPILFNSGLTTLRDASIPKLDRIAAFLIRHPDVSIEIIGHTDNLGPEPVNRNVSAERAGIVMNYLISQGIDPSRLKSKGMGSLDPIESNDTQLGRQANRRIEFLITEREGPAANR